MPRAALIGVLVAGSVLAVGLVAAAFVVAAGSDDDSSATDVTLTFESPRQLELPLADEGEALTLARRNGRVLVGIAVGPNERIQVAVVEGEQAVAESDLTFTVDGRLETPTPCGQACWELDVRQARELVVNAPETFRFELPAALPASAASLFADVTRTMEALRTYRFHERLSAGVDAGTSSLFEVQAPDRMQFRTADGSRTIIVGRSRWDYRAGRWERTPFPGLELPSYMWDGARNARIVGRAGGRRVLAVFDREPVPSWFRLTIDGRNRVLDAEMLAPSHFMRQRFRDFNAPLRITPPR